MFLFIFICFSLLNLRILSVSSNTYVFSGGTNTYIAFDSWRPCLTGYIRFDIRTNTEDGTLAYIDDRGKFDFFYLKLIQGKLRLLFNLGNDRQAININMKINDNKWHTILIKRNGQITSLNIDNGLAENSAITYSEDLYFGSATHNDYEASPFYFGGIPSILERPSSGNLSSFDVYMQPRFHGQLRNLIYKNCTESSYLIQPKPINISGGISLIPNSHCSEKICGSGICLITNDQTYQCYCNEINYQDKNCQYKQQTNELIFNGKQYFQYPFNKSISSYNEILTFQMKTNHYDGILFQLIDSQYYIKLKQGQLIIEYKINDIWYESLGTIQKDIYLIDNQWHYIQIKRNYGQITIIIDQYYLQIENDIKISPNDYLWNITQIFIGGNQDLNLKKFYGCLKDISLIFNENFNQSLNNFYSYNNMNSNNCQSLINPIQFLTSSSFISFYLTNISQQINLSFHFETYSSDCIILYCQSNQDSFLGLDLIDGFIYLTINIQKQNQRQELFQQRFNDGQTHFFQLDMNIFQQTLTLNITMDYRQNTQIYVRNLSTLINLHTITIGGVNSAVRWLPTNYYSGIMQRGLIGCFFDLEINNKLIDLTKFINFTNNDITSKIGPCSVKLSTKRECLCEHNGECRLINGDQWSCDCSKTGYTGRRCEQIAYHLDLNQIQTLELNTNIQWSDQINIIAFNLKAIHDEENFLEIRSCRLSSKCDSIRFSIRNGFLYINFSLINLSIEYPFLLDKQWHSINFQRINTNLLLHIDNHIIQKRINITSLNSSILTTIWIIFYGNKQIQIEDLRLYDQSIFSKFLTNQFEQIKLKTRTWKPINAISFTNQESSYLEIQLNEILCQDCQLNTFYFQFRTIDLNGLLLFSKIQTNINSSSEYFILKLVNGYLHLQILNQSLHELYKIETKQILNNNHWHHISFYRATCFASLTINSHMINLREYIKSNSQIRNNCFLNSQCPLKYCFNTGICHERIECDCQHTSFQGKYCTNFKLGYLFNDSLPGLIFDQPFFKEKNFSNYKISFGIKTNMKNISEIIRINEQISIELYQNSIKIKIIGNDFLHNDKIINDGFYHLIQMKYNRTGYLHLNVDNKMVMKQIKTKILFDKPLVLLIGQNPAFKNPFQGQMYGLESDIYSIFDLISPTFQRISFSPIRIKTSSSSLPSIIYPTNPIEDRTCSYQPYDDICIVSLDKNINSLLLFPNLTLQSPSFSRITNKFLNSTLSYQQLSFHLSSSIDSPNISSNIISIHTSNENQLIKKFSWQNIFIFIIPILCGIILCFIITICCCIKYRRKDAGVYELVETQRFRPLIVELPPSPGEHTQKKLSNSIGKKLQTKSSKRQKTSLIRTDEHREFYI